MIAGAVYTSIRASKYASSSKPKCSVCGHELHNEPCRKLRGIFHKRICLCTHKQQNLREDKQ